MDENKVDEKKMDENKIATYLASNLRMFPADKISRLRAKMAQADDSRYISFLSVKLKDPTEMFFISLFLGEIGVDRFMLGEVGMGILKLLTGGLCGILWIIDLIRIPGKTRQYNFDRVMDVC